MKTSLQHLPEHIQSELKRITETITELVKPEMIILFGSYSRGNYVEYHRHVEDGINVVYKSDYDILVVTKHHQDAPPRLDKEIRRRIKRAENMQTPPHIIFHDIKFLNRELEEGHYFFTDIVKEGTMLYNTGNYQLATPRELSPKERQDKAQIHYNTWFNKAEKDLKYYKISFAEGDFDKSAFELHQATEALFKTVELVFTDYKSKTHDLQELNKMAGYQDARFKQVFPNQTEEEKRLFEILVRAYIDSRYKMSYTVSPTDLQWLATRVQLLKQLTEDICKEKIAGFVK